MAQLNLLIHGNAQGASLWCNKRELPELSQAERSYLSSFYNSSGENKSTVSFVIDWRTDEVTKKLISYYHYVIQGNVSEAEGRASGYVGLTLRISESFTPCLLQTYDLLRRLFEEKVVGTLVDKTKANGYQFRVAKLEELDDTFRQWEEDLAKGYSSVLSCPSSCDLAPEKQGEMQYFSLDDLWKIQVSPDLIISGRGLLFSSTKLSLQSTSQVKKLKEEINNLKDENNNLNEEMAKQRTVAKSDQEKLEQEVKKLKDELSKKNIKLGNQSDILAQIQNLLGDPKKVQPTHPVQSPYIPPLQSERGHKEDDGRATLLERLFLPVLMGVLFLILLSQAYLIYKDSFCSKYERCSTPEESGITMGNDKGANASTSSESSTTSGENQGGSRKPETDKGAPDHGASTQKPQPFRDK